MTTVRHILPTTLLGLTLTTGMAYAAPREIAVSEEVLGKVTVLAPTDEPKSFVVLLSDTGGIDAAMRATAEKLTAQGAAVALVDSQAFITALDASDEKDCHYAFGDFEDAAHLAQRELGMTTWRWPVLLGLGELGGTLAYLSIAQTPENTAAGAVSTGLRTTLRSRLPICAGATASATGQPGEWTYVPPETIPARWAYVSQAAPPPAVQTFIGSAGDKGSSVVPNQGESPDDAAIRVALDIGAPPTSELGDLPLVELPTEGPPRGLVVLLSGDGGWRDIDKSIGESLQASGVAVVGIDSLRYFWSTKDPETIAKDLSRIVAHYKGLWGAKRIALAGYSLGADVIPFAWPKIPEGTRKEIDLLVLMGLEPTADFQISVAGWLGVSSSSDVDVKPYLSALPMTKTMCFYGEDEVPDNDTACVFPELAGATIVKRPGGHHFDGDYETVAKMILDRLK